MGGSVLLLKTVLLLLLLLLLLPLPLPLPLPLSPPLLLPPPLPLLFPQLTSPATYRSSIEKDTAADTSLVQWGWFLEHHKALAHTGTSPVPDWPHRKVASLGTSTTTRFKSQRFKERHNKYLRRSSLGCLLFAAGPSAACCCLLGTAAHVRWSPGHFRVQR